MAMMMSAFLAHKTLPMGKHVQAGACLTMGTAGAQCMQPDGGRLCSMVQHGGGGRLGHLRLHIKAGCSNQGAYRRALQPGPGSTRCWGSAAALPNALASQTEWSCRL